MKAEKPVRMLIVAGIDFPPVRGGVGSVMYYLARSARAEGVAVLTSVKNAVRDRNYRVYSSKIFERRPKPFQLASALALLLRIQVVFKPTVVIIGDVWEANVGLWFKKLFRTPLLIIACGNEILRLQSGKWDKPYQALAEADAVMPISRYTRDLLIERGVGSANITIINPGTDPDIFYPLPPDEVVILKRHYGVENRKIILTVANLHKLKGQDMVARALPIVREKIPQAVYLIVGKGRDEACIRQAVVEAGVEEHVKFLTGVESIEELRGLYNICDVFVMPSRLVKEENLVEGFGITYLEANACGKPVIGGRSGGVSEAISEGETGLLVNPEDPEELARAIVRLLENPESAQEMGRKGRKRVVEHLNWRRTADEVLKVCREVLSG